MNNINKSYKVALVGNPNCGKTTLFNALTKMRQTVGNWTGVTVEKKTGKYHKNKLIEIIDLPGVYSLKPYSPEEKVTSSYLINQKPNLIINIIDATNLERSLNLTLQLLEIGQNVILALNMADELKKQQMSIDTLKLYKSLKLKAILISAAKKENLFALMDEVYKTLKNPLAQKLLSPQQKTSSLQKYQKARKITSEVLTQKSKKPSFSRKIDKVITNKYLAFPIFFLIIWLTYYVSIQLTGKSVTLLEEGLENFIQYINSKLSLPLWLKGLICDGLLRGMGTVLTFLPQIAALFFFISLLESCGYMARVAYIMDKLFNKIGLSGKSFIPMIIGCGCSVPAIMSSKTIKNLSQKRLTIILTPFVPCSAKLPIFALIIAAFFPKNIIVAPFIYVLGILMIIVIGLILKNTKAFSQQKECFIMELPPYRIPTIGNILMSIWQKVKAFIAKAGTVILLASIVIWFLSSFNYQMQMVDAKYSLLASLGKLLSPLFKPLGFGDWRVAVAILTGTIAKETIISSFSVLLNSSGSALIMALKEIFCPLSALSFMAFVLLSFPCISALAAAKKEMGGAKWLGIAMIIQFLTAYSISYMIYNIGGLILYNKWFVLLPLFLVAVAIIGHFVYKRLEYK